MSSRSCILNYIRDTIMSNKEQRMLLKDLETQLKQVEEKLGAVNPYSHPDVVKARADLDATIKRVQEQIKDQFDELRREKGALEEKVISIREAIATQARESVPQHIRVIVIGFTIGVNYSGPLSVRWWSADQRFFILTVGGGTYWSGREEHYGQAKHSLHDATLFDKKGHGYDNFLKTMVGNEIVGRLTAEGKVRLMSMAQREEKR